MTAISYFMHGKRYCNIRFPFTSNICCIFSFYSLFIFNIDTPQFELLKVSFCWSTNAPENQESYPIKKNQTHTHRTKAIALIKTNDKNKTKRNNRLTCQQKAAHHHLRMFHFGRHLSFSRLSYLLPFSGSFRSKCPNSKLPITIYVPNKAH